MKYYKTVTILRSYKIKTFVIITHFNSKAKLDSKFLRLLDQLEVREE